MSVRDDAVTESTDVRPSDPARASGSTEVQPCDPVGQTIHAGCVVIGEAGILIRGPSGVGKSALARQLIGAAQALGQFARLVSDDRTQLVHRAGRLLARPVPAIAGRIEVRGLGLVALPSEPAAVIRLVVDGLPQAGARMPEPEEAWTSLLGVALPRLALPIDPGLAQIVLMRLADHLRSGAADRPDKAAEM